MFKDYKSYQDGVERVKELQEIEKHQSLSVEDSYELDLLMDAVMQYEDLMDAEARAEHEFMDRFEEHFLSSTER